MGELAVIGDIHGELEMLDRVLDVVKAREVDGILLVGDLGVNSLWGESRSNLAAMARYHASVDAIFARVSALGKPYLWVAGNHDLPELGGMGNTDRRVSEIAGFRVFGIGGGGPQHFGFPYEWDEQDIEALAIPEVDILLCHAPPIRTELDRLYHTGEHVGSEAIRTHASKHRGFLVCGHIHEARGADLVEDCLCLNTGALGAPYAMCLVGFLTRRPQEADTVRLHFVDDGHEVVWDRARLSAGR